MPRKPSMSGRNFSERDISRVKIFSQHWRRFDGKTSCGRTILQHVVHKSSERWQVSSPHSAKTPDTGIIKDTLVEDAGHKHMNLHTRQSRRQFIKEALATTGTLGLTRAFGQVGSRDRSQIDSHALKNLRAQLKGSLILPTDSSYEVARRIYFWNPDTERRPALVIRCAQADDVRYGVDLARRYGLEVA